MPKGQRDGKRLLRRWLLLAGRASDCSGCNIVDSQHCDFVPFVTEIPFKSLPHEASYNEVLIPPIKHVVQHLNEKIPVHNLATRDCFKVPGCDIKFLRNCKVSVSPTIRTRPRWSVLSGGVFYFAASCLATSVIRQLHLLLPLGKLQNFFRHQTLYPLPSTAARPGGSQICLLMRRIGTGAPPRSSVNNSPGL